MLQWECSHVTAASAWRGDGDRLPAPRGGFSQFWRRENLREVVSAQRLADALWRRACQSRGGWARLCNAEARLCNAEDCAAMIGCLGLLGSTDGHTKFSHRVPELAFAS